MRGLDLLHFGGFPCESLGLFKLDWSFTMHSTKILPSDCRILTRGSLPRNALAAHFLNLQFFFWVFKLAGFVLVNLRPEYIDLRSQCLDFFEDLLNMVSFHVGFDLEISLK
jgi:hypothetical protein